jgi:DNA-directed RNA polymerase beta subunit
MPIVPKAITRYLTRKLKRKQGDERFENTMTAINYKASFLVPDFVEIQRRSFSRFLEKGIIEEFSKINPIRSDISKFELTFYPESYLIISPEYTVTEAVLQGKTYSCKLYLPAKLSSEHRARRTNRNKVNAKHQASGPQEAPGGHPLADDSNPSQPLWTSPQHDGNNVQLTRTASLKDSDELAKLGESYGPVSPSLTESVNSATRGPKPLLPEARPPLSKGGPMGQVLKTGNPLGRNWVTGTSKRPEERPGTVSPWTGQPSLRFPRGPSWGKGPTSFESEARLPVPAAPARASAARPYKTWPTGRLGREPGEDNALANGTETTLSWVLVGNLPLMTKRGHFIVNGSPRVVINQLVRSPGVYFHERTWGFGKRKKRIVYADFVSRRGAWLRIQADKEGDTWARLKKTPKVPFALFYEGMSICERNPREWTIADREALLELHEEVNPTKKDLSPENGHQFLVQKFKNRRTYDLGRVGRKRLNKRFGLSISSHQLTSQDLYAAFEQIQELQNDRILVDDIDHLKNRRVRASGELVQGQFETGLYRLEKAILSKMRKPPKEVSPRTLLNTKPLNAALREFFGSSPLSQYMDQTNPLAEITQKRRISSLGPGGISRETAGMAVRGIHPTHYGRICPIETPEGKNAGLVNSLTTYTRVGDDGILETPYFHVLQGQVQARMGFQYFSAGNEEHGEFRVAPGDVQLSTYKLLPATPFPVREAGNREEDFRHADREGVNYMAISPIQMISVATSLIPFLEHDDANRALMGSNMQRQAVPLLQPERPLVGTGLEALVVAESGHALQAELSGYVSCVSGGRVSVHSCLPGNRRETALRNDSLSVVTKPDGTEWLQPQATALTARGWGFEGLASRGFTGAGLTGLTGAGALAQARFAERALAQARSAGRRHASLASHRPHKGSKATLASLPMHAQQGQRGGRGPGPVRPALVRPAAARPFWHGVHRLNLANGAEIGSFERQSPVGSIGPIRPLDTAYLALNGNGNKSVYPRLRETAPVEQLVPASISSSRYRARKLSYLRHGLSLSSGTGPQCPNPLILPWKRGNQGQALCENKFSKVNGAPAGIRGSWSGSETTLSSLSPVTEQALQASHASRGQASQASQGQASQGFGVSLNGPDPKPVPCIPTGCKDGFEGHPNTARPMNGQGPSSKPVSWNGWTDASEGSGRQGSPHLQGDWQSDVFTRDYHLQRYHRSNQETCLTQTSAVSEGDWVQKGDLLADCSASRLGELALGRNILIAYLPWEGYNFEDAVVISERLISDDVYTSIHVQKYDIEIRETRFGVEKITPQIPGITDGEKERLDWRGIAKIGSWVKEGDILVGKVSPKSSQPLSPYERLAYDIANVEAATTEDTSLRVPKGVEGRVINCQSFQAPSVAIEEQALSPGRVRIYLAEKRKLQVGDKVAGRHGNKGIVSTVLPRQDMPYLPDGTIVDMVLNPLGIPSRMNVGQVFECLLGLAGVQLGQQFKITPFDEIYGAEASRSLVYLKLYQAKLRTNQDWLFNPRFPGKTALLDGRTGRLFDQWVTVGYAYMLKLVHLVDEKIHARSTGPYSLVTKQPLGGRSKHGGQRLGEMEVWALEGFGAAYTLQEMLTSKSDDVVGREQVVEAILFKGKMSLGNPEAFKVLVRELQSLCLDVGVYAISPGRLQREAVDIGRIP